MGQTTARIKKGNNHFEILVDMDAALNFKKGQGNAAGFLEFDKIFKDAKNGDIASTDEIETAFGTSDISTIAEEIVRSGEVLVNQEHRSTEQDQRVKQVVNFLVVNAIDPQSGNPFTPERIRSALDQAHVNIKSTPIDQQMNEILELLSKVVPIKLDTKRIKVTIPAMHTGKAYGVISQYKESESWNDDGSLEAILAVPSGIIIDFYEKLNGVTHGAAYAEDIKEE